MSIDQIDPESLESAINTALDALATRLAEDYGKPEKIDHYRDFMRRSIASAPEQYTHENSQGDVSMPFNTAAQLLGAIAAMQAELNHIAQYQEWHHRDLELWIKAQEVYSDTLEADYERRNKDTLEVLGFTGHKRDAYAHISRKFLILKSRVGDEAAYKHLAKERGEGVKVSSIKKGIRRYLNRLNSN